ncbi:VTT domain-containing protein [Streptomyces sp. DSM 44917]|uniref:VTT domain-containing protein n=1 Tax=Streptomyces boetiae TaxID=3075541 RepID=A0ABU2L450_9ACTN|nr:VTT domain-containing protein [Streptomyces sp. DSM 44917]MDT0306332.1 VTT domain-containing protein [Streptomyces sp. DSM 44917]
MDGALWMYVLLAVTTVPPLFPNAALITQAGAMAQSGELSLTLVVLVVGGSALAGDAAIYGIGRLARGRALRWLGRTPRREAALHWTSERMHAHGLPFVVGVRFLPSGRIVGGLTAAIVGYSARRYLLGTAIAEAVWAFYSVAIGYWGGSALEGTWPPLIIGTAVSVLVAGVAQLLSLPRGFRLRSLFRLRRGARSASRTVRTSLPDPAAARTPAEGPAPAAGPGVSPGAPDAPAGGAPTL